MYWNRHKRRGKFGFGYIDLGYRRFDLWQNPLLIKYGEIRSQGKHFSALVYEEHSSVDAFVQFGKKISTRSFEIQMLHGEGKRITIEVYTNPEILRQEMLKHRDIDCACYFALEFLGKHKHILSDKRSVFFIERLSLISHPKAIVAPRAYGFHNPLHSKVFYISEYERACRKHHLPLVDTRWTDLEKMIFQAEGQPSPVAGMSLADFVIENNSLKKYHKKWNKNERLLFEMAVT